VKTVKKDTSSSRPSVMCIIATDWVTDGCLLPEIYRENLQTQKSEIDKILVTRKYMKVSYLRSKHLSISNVFTFEFIRVTINLL